MCHQYFARKVTAICAQLQLFFVNNLFLCKARFPPRRKGPQSPLPFGAYIRSLCQLKGYGKIHCPDGADALSVGVYLGNVSEICFATRLMAPFISCEAPATPSEE